MNTITIIAGNWKMNKTAAEAVLYLEELENSIQIDKSLVEVVIFPAFTAIEPALRCRKSVKIGAQNVHFEESGAYTGEISVMMLKNLVDYVLIGHSERRHIFHESDELLNKKLTTCLNHDLDPFFCCGENLDERENGKTYEVVKEQIIRGFMGIQPNKLASVTIAYEPVWAIGTGVVASPEQAQEVHAYIRSLLHQEWGISDSVPLLYGGSVKPDNSQDILLQDDIDGVLVGGASLKVAPFSAIIDACNRISNS